MSTLVPVLGLLAGLFGVLDTIPYVRDTVGRTTVPHRGTWFVWSVLEIAAVLSQRADGASWSLIMAITQAVGTSLIFGLSLRLGCGGLSRSDLLLIGFAAVGIAGWLVAEAPVFATACIVGADLVAVAMMLPKAWRNPGSETMSTYALAAVSGACAAGAVGALTPSLLLYPVYFCVSNAALALLIHHRARLLQVAEHPPVADKALRTGGILRADADIAPRSGEAGIMFNGPSELFALAHGPLTDGGVGGDTSQEQRS